MNRLAKVARGMGIGANDALRLTDPQADNGAFQRSLAKTGRGRSFWQCRSVPAPQAEGAIQTGQRDGSDSPLASAALSASALAAAHCR